MLVPNVNKIWTKGVSFLFSIFLLYLCGVCDPKPPEPLCLGIESQYQRWYQGLPKVYNLDTGIEDLKYKPGSEGQSL